ncbi:hypothetical protein O9K51_00204 [Purpureocillium lavendulum]|uniref:Uncharacterized protein n=1 Tax=Purpureocillium lavendulum TaxID=1247861 RepID=A0AB34G334_9HYPO|nr:hypothetical protein O9K51_00204 [Purpureocillium lavendulum]
MHNMKNSVVALSAFAATALAHGGHADTKVFNVDKAGLEVAVGQDLTLDVQNRCPGGCKVFFLSGKDKDTLDESKQTLLTDKCQGPMCTVQIASSNHEDNAVFGLKLIPSSGIPFYSASIKVTGQVEVSGGSSKPDATLEGNTIDGKETASTGSTSTPGGNTTEVDETNPSVDSTPTESTDIAATPTGSSDSTGLGPTNSTGLGSTNSTDSDSTAGLTDSTDSGTETTVGVPEATESSSNSSGRLSSASVGNSRAEYSNTVLGLLPTSINNSTVITNVGGRVAIPMALLTGAIVGALALV